MYHSYNSYFNPLIYGRSIIVQLHVYAHVHVVITSTKAFSSLALLQIRLFLFLEVLHLLIGSM